MVFTFKNKPLVRATVKDDVEAYTSAAASDSNHDSPQSASIRICDLDGTSKTIQSTTSTPTPTSLLIQNVHNSSISMPFLTETIHIKGVVDSTLLLLPTTTSIFISDCVGLRLVATGQQMRIHDSQRLSLYVHRNTAVIIENCHDVMVAPYRLRVGQNTMSALNSDEDRAKLLSFLTDDAQLSCATAGKSPNWRQLPKNEWESFQLP